MERGLYMIEIIREESYDSEQEKRELPKNIRQIGSPDIGDRIYIENKVHEYMHPYDALQEKTVYVLLGRFENLIGRQCVFVEAAICLEEIAFEGECPVWSDDSWAYLYKKLKHAYDNMVIVGWAMDIRGQLPNLTVAIEKLHRTYFGGEHQILYLMDSLEKEDAFYSLKNGYLKRRAGYYIYYAQKQFGLSAIMNDKREKDTIVQKQIEEKLEYRQEENQEEKNQEEKKPEPESWNAQFFAGIRDDEDYGREEEKEQERTNSYRTYLEQKGQKTKMIPSYGLSILLFLVVCGLGFAAFQNHQKMNAMETALMQMNSAKMTETETQTPASETDVTVKVESVEGNIIPQDNAQTGAAVDVTQGEEQTAENATQENGQTEATAEGDDIQVQTNTEQTETQPQTDTGAVQTAGQTDNAQAQETAVVQSEASQYLSQGYYIVQKGDSLVGICRKVYNTTAMMDKLCETNGIENPDAIYEGQYLTLPN